MDPLNIARKAPENLRGLGEITRDVTVKAFQDLCLDIQEFRVLFTSTREALPFTDKGGVPYSPIDSFEIVRIDASGQAIAKGSSTLYSFSAPQRVGRVVAIELTDGEGVTTAFSAAKLFIDRKFEISAEEGNGQFYCLLGDFHSDINSEAQYPELFKGRKSRRL